MRRIAAEFPAIAFHLHGNTLWPVDLILSVDGIDVLELNYDAGVCNLGEVIEAWKKVQRHGKPLIAFADVTIDELRHVLHELSPVGLSIQSISPTMDLARPSGTWSMARLRREGAEKWRIRNWNEPVNN